MEGPRYCSWAPDRLLRDAVVRRMNAEAFGGYVSLLVEAWLDPSGRLPTDAESLALLARMGKAAWSKYAKTILSLFEEDGGFLYSPIVDEAREKIARKSQIGKAAVEAREKRRAEKLGQLEPNPASDDDRPIIARLSKEKEKEKENPPSNPSPAGSGPRKASSGTKPKALRKGDPKNAETWDAFDTVYPRPSNGRKLERADARLTWDLLAEDGEDMGKVVEGATRYRAWIDALKKREYVAMMTTWLNQRRWEESYYIDPSSEDGKWIQAEKEAEDRERRSAHQAKFQPAYDAYVLGLAQAGVSAPGFEEEWRAEVEATLAKRKKMGMTGAVKIAEAMLEDPGLAREDQVRRWREKNPVLSFWEWDDAANPERFV